MIRLSEPYEITIVEVLVGNENVLPMEIHFVDCVLVVCSGLRGRARIEEKNGMLSDNNLL